MAGIAPQGVREGRPEAALPPIHRDHRRRDDPGRPHRRSLRPTLPQSDPPRGRPRPRSDPHPVARRTVDRVHLPLTTTDVRGLIIFPAVEIGDEGSVTASRGLRCHAELWRARVWRLRFWAKPALA